MAWQTWMNNSKPFARGEIVLVAVVGDADALHQFHDKERPPFVGGTGVQHLGDVRMIHQRQRLSLGLESGDDLFGVHAELDDLERDAAADGLLLLRHIHHAATAIADFLEDLVAANAVAGLFGKRFDQRQVRRRSRFDGHIRIERGASLLVRLQQCFDALPQYHVACAGTLQVGGAFLPCRKLQRGGEDLLFA